LLIHVHSYLFIDYPRGTLQDLFDLYKKSGKNGQCIKFAEIDCLNYLKQLMWGVYTLHEKYNLVHRNITPLTLYIDQCNNLKLCDFSSCVKAHD
jgi:serine/threonine protein kinase